MLMSRSSGVKLELILGHWPHLFVKKTLKISHIQTFANAEWHANKDQTAQLSVEGS